MEKKVIGVCLIGCGRAGMIHARNYMNKVDHARMVAVVDVVEEAAKAAAAEEAKAKKESKKKKKDDEESVLKD